MITSFKKILGQPHTTPSSLPPFATATLCCWVFWHPQLILGHFCTCLSPHSHFPWTLKPLLLGSGKDQTKKSKSDFCPPWNTSTKSSKSPRRILFSVQQHGLQTDVFEPILSPRNPMQNRVVWVLQKGSRDWLWELDSNRLGWRSSMFSFNNCRMDARHGTGANAILRPGRGWVLLL